jgi:nucleotide-binding universal stress UspA family protein
MLPELRTILYATDLTHRSSEVFQYAMSVAQKHGGKITIIHALEPLTPFAKSMVDLYVSKEQSDTLHREAKEKMIAEIRERLEHFCSDELCVDPVGRERVADILVLEGRPSEVILKEADRIRSDLIVMGSHGHSAVGEILLGTTAHRVMQHARVPVLLVRSRKD